MARTTNLQLTGAAARTDLADQRQWLLEQSDPHRKSKSRFAELQLQLLELMGEEKFNAWYDDDRNVPQELQWSRMDAIFDKMEKLITSLKRTGRSAAPERPATNEPGRVTRQAPDPTDCITESEGE